MKNLTKKRTLFYGLFLLMSFHVLRAAKSFNQPYVQPQKDHTLELTRAKRKQLVYGYCRGYGLSKKTSFIIICFVHDNPLKYNNKPLPHDLSGQDLSDFDFTGCRFMYTNLTNTNLANVILTNTTCDYQKAFLDNSKKNKLTGGDWYKENLPKDLKSIAVVYPKLTNNTHKVKLLHVANGLARVPFYKGMDFYIKVYYWSSILLQAKQALGNPYGDHLVCSLQNDLQEEGAHYCWTTNYLQNRVNIATRAPHANFLQYLKDFTSGLTKYQCSSTQPLGFKWYKKHITMSIEGLATAYPNINNKQLQQTACNIAHALSKSYQIQQDVLLYHYLFYQHRLLQLKNLVNIGVRNEIYYSLRYSNKTLPSVGIARENDIQDSNNINNQDSKPVV